MAAKKGVRLKFLYLPSFGGQAGNPTEYDFYNQFGEVLIPPVEIFRETDYWADGDHLNDEGARQLTLWLATQF